MNLRRATASRLPLLQHCAYPARSDVTHPPYEQTEEAAQGVARHKVYACIVAGAPVDPEEMQRGNIDEVHVERFSAWVRENLSDQCVAEQGFAYATATDRARAITVVDRDYSEAKLDEWVGTADVVDPALLLRNAFEYPCSYVLVLDWKTGQAAHVEPARTNAQLHALALFAARTYGRQFARVVVARVDDEGYVKTDEHDLDAMDLEDVAMKLAILEAAIESATPVAGSWCTDHYCPLAGVCPAHVAEVSNLVHAHGAMPRPMPGWTLPVPQNELHAAFLVRVLPMVEAWAENAKRAVKAYAEEHGGAIHMPGGGVYKKVVSSQREIQTNEQAVAVLREIFGAAVDVALDVDATPRPTLASIERAAKIVAEKRQIGALKQRAIDALTEVGAVVGKPRVQWKEVG